MPPGLKRIEDPGTLKDRAFKVIKKAIMVHDLQPGKIYGVSKRPTTCLRPRPIKMTLPIFWRLTGLTNHTVKVMSMWKS